MDVVFVDHGTKNLLLLRKMQEIGLRVAQWGLELTLLLR